MCSSDLDGAQRAGLELGGARAERAVARHILHLAMPAPREPFHEARLGRREIRVGDADRLEAELGTPGLDALRERGIVHGVAS